jgi:hypothetical protein
MVSRQRVASARPSEVFFEVQEGVMMRSGRRKLDLFAMDRNGRRLQ